MRRKPEVQPSPIPGGGAAVERVKPGLRARLSTEMRELAPAQARLATYLLQNLATVSDLSITDLALEAEVSVGTISLLCRRLGLGGYQDLRLTLAREAVTVASAYGEGVFALKGSGDLTDGSVEGGIARVFGASAEALVATAQQLQRDSVDAAANHLARARRVEWVGSGTAGLVAAEGALKLRKLGIDTWSHLDGHQQAMSAALLTPDDVLVAVSHSGRTLDVLRTVRLARDAGARVIAITGNQASPLQELADVVLGTVSYDAAFQIEPMASTVAELSVVQLLFLLLLERGGESAHEQLSRTQAAVEPQRMKGRYR